MPQTANATSFLTEDDQIHWLALRMSPGLGTRKAAQLIGIFRTPQSVFRASRSELEAAGLSPAVAQSIASGCAFEDAVTQREKLVEDRRGAYSPHRSPLPAPAQGDLRSAPRCCTPSAKWICWRR